MGPDPGDRSGRALHVFQAYEYSHAAFGFSGNIYGANFFMATGFHGFHVIIGTIFLFVCLMRRHARPFHRRAACRLRGGRLVLALRRRGLAVPVRLDLHLGRLTAAADGAADPIPTWGVPATGRLFVHLSWASRGPGGIPQYRAKASGAVGCPPSRPSRHGGDPRPLEDSAHRRSRR